MEYRIIKNGNGRYYPQKFDKKWIFSWKKSWINLGEWAYHFEYDYIERHFKTHKECKEWLKKYIAREKEFALGTRVVETITDGK